MVITAGWAVALIVVGILYRSMPASEHWWLWTCVTGVVLGSWGLWYVPRLKRGRARAAERRAAARPAAQAPSGNGPPGHAAAGNDLAENEAPGLGRPAQVPPEKDSKTVSSSDTPGRSTRS